MRLQNWRTKLRDENDGRSAMPRLRSLISALVVGVLVAATLSGCGCRPGYVGPYGGVHPGRCWVG